MKAQQRTSLRSKLVRAVVAALLLGAAGAFVVVMIQSYSTSQRQIAEVEELIRNGIEVKGRILADNHAIALQGMVDANAFGDVKGLIETTVAEDQEVVYGLFLDTSERAWAYESPVLDEEPNVKGAWRALGLTERDIAGTGRTVDLFGESISEFAAPVLLEGESVGHVRYGLSNRRVEDAVASARVAANLELLGVLLRMLLMVAASIALGILVTRRGAERITRPLDILSRAAEQISRGARGVRVKVESGDEMEVLAESFNKMVSDLEDFSRNLELKVETRTRDLAKKTDDVVNMLENIEQGIFTLQPDLTLHPEYSVHLEHILGRTDLAGKPLEGVLLETSDLGVGRIAAVRTCLQVNMGNMALLWDCNAHVLPDEFTFTRPDGERRLLAVSWIGLADDEGAIESIMVTIRDITELTALREQAEHQRQNLLIVGEILALRPEDFEHFVETSNAFIDRNLYLIECGDPAAVAEMFRNAHTIKGNASLNGLTKLNDVVHACEDTYRALSEGAIAWNPEQLGENEEQIRAVLDRYVEEYRVRLANWGESSGQQVQVAALRDGITIGEETGSVDDVLDYLHRQVRWATSTDVWDLLQRPRDNAVRIAIQRGKPSPNFDLLGGLRVPSHLGDTITDVFMHLLRNSVDHGIEAPEDRLAAGKDASGTITISVRMVGDRVEFRVRDDGRGMNLRRLRALYEERNGSAPRNHEQLAWMIFDSGVSTAPTVTDVSGRGVGLDAVRSFLAETGGTVRVEFDAGASVDDEFRGFSIVLVCGSIAVTQNTDQVSIRDLVA